MFDVNQNSVYLAFVYQSLFYELSLYATLISACLLFLGVLSTASHTEVTAVSSSIKTGTSFRGDILGSHDYIKQIIALIVFSRLTFWEIDSCKMILLCVGR